MARRVLLQLDCDPHPSSFDAIVALDAGVDVVLPYGGVTPDNVVPLVHGAMFTRGGSELASTAIFIGGSDVALAEAVQQRVCATFFGPVRVGVMLDPSGANTTAAAAVVAAARHLPLADAAGARECPAVVLGATGPVGQRVARLLVRRGAPVTLVSRSAPRAGEAAEVIRRAVPGAMVDAVDLAALSGDARRARALLDKARLVVAAGAAGVTLLTASQRRSMQGGVFIDLNAVPPVGIEGIAPTDKARSEGTALFYGALGVGGTKMKIHRAAIARLFGGDAPVLDAEEMLDIGGPA
ncbi:MAG: NAD(P)-dependent methylenetetrahydromethanopterin dehydrogenase [Pirellulales bacterium]